MHLTHVTDNQKMSSVPWQSVHIIISQVYNKYLFFLHIKPLHIQGYCNLKPFTACTTFTLLFGSTDKLNNNNILCSYHQQMHFFITHIKC